MAVVRYVYLRIEALSSHSPLAPVLCSRRRGRDCMRIPGHELGRVTPAEIFASTVDAVELGATRRQCRGTGRGDRSISTSGSYSAPGANGPSGGTGGPRPLGGQLGAAAMMLDEVDQKRTESVDLCVVEAPPQLVLHLSTLREGPLTDAFPGRAQVQPLLAAVPGSSERCR